MKSEGYSFRMSTEKIRDFMNMPPEQKLDWLEDANNLISIAVSKEKLDRWKRFKAGDKEKQ